jgi:hypothetical protein
MRLHSTWLAVALVGAAATSARAEDPPAPAVATDAAAAPAAAAGDSLTLPKGRVLIDAFIEASLDSGAVFKPVSISPDLWYGVSDKLTVGLVHSALGETGFMGAAGDSLCITGSSSCGKFYKDVALDARFNLKQDTFSYAFDGGLAFRSLSPNETAIKLGLVARWHKEKLSIELEPSLLFGLNNRKITEMVGGVTETVYANGDSLGVPVTVLYAMSPKLNLVGQSGLFLPFENTGDAYFIPLSAGITYRVNVPASILLAFSFPQLIGGAGTGDVRTLTLGGNYAF